MNEAIALNEVTALKEKSNEYYKCITSRVDKKEVLGSC